MREHFLEVDKRHFSAVIRQTKDMLERGQYPDSFNMPLFLQYDLTYRCNLKCLHCFNQSGEKLEPEMTVEEWLRLSREVIAKGGIFNLVLSGGEALLLGDDLFKIIDLFALDNTPITLITNGYLVDERWATKLAAYDSLQIRLSIDGSESTLHDGLRGVPGSFDRAVKAARHFSRVGIPFHISSCVTPASLEKMDKLVELATELKAEFLALDLVLSSGRATDNPQILLNPEQVNVMLKNIYEIRQKYKLPVMYSTGYSMAQYHLAGFPNRVVVVKASGDVRLSCMAPFIIGNVREETLEEIWLKKGVTAWQHPDVVRYLENTDLVTAKNNYLINYNGKEFKI